ncbi:CoA transferase [Chitinasiproducens palmae]|uniref:CoA-transferase family III n=1 Tax=Chitinasiproducens palmae TaxID=1770053 RepID=A0A1H2PTZ8_9BURK|nr:CoA transferase [Chitinasiproducens palmae]SDV50617.1 CoA-transferase family III [Chitinasiproducens palmae]
MRAIDHLAEIWTAAGHDAGALSYCALDTHPQTFPSSFAVDLAAQTTVAAAALAASEFAHTRGAARQRIAVSSPHAAVEAAGWFAIDGRVPDLWDAFSGLYPCRDGYVRIHANFAHHRNGALRLLGVDPDTATRADAEAALRDWEAVAFESAATERGLVVSALRSFEVWDGMPQGQVLATAPLLTIERIGDGAPRSLPALGDTDPVLSGIRVLDLTRILAGPVGTRTLAAFGADVMLVNSPTLPNIDAIAETSRGKRSVHVDLKTPAGVDRLRGLIHDAHVFVQGYRPGALAHLGFAPHEIAALRPGIVQVSLSAYGRHGPWSAKRGFDSLVQTATGFNVAEGAAFGEAKPRALPMQILDQATGFLIAFGAATALRRQRLEGGSWHVEVSLAQTAQWLRRLPRITPAECSGPPDRTPYLDTYASGFGTLEAVRPSAMFERTPAAFARPSKPPGSDAAAW